MVQDTDYGSDLSVWDDTDEMFSEVAADSIIAVEQAAYRLLITPRSKLPDHPSYGYSIRHILHEPLTTQALNRHRAAIQAELRKDERILDVSVALTPITTRSLRIVVEASTTQGPFKLTMNVSDAEVLRIAMSS